jgi:hypothetical protein
MFSTGVAGGTARLCQVWCRATRETATVSQSAEFRVHASPCMDFEPADVNRTILRLWADDSI